MKRWREERTDTYKWAYVDVKEGTSRIFCSICREYGRKHGRNPYGNEGSRNMQMSALEEHNNNLLHKEALRLQQASVEKIIVDKPIYVKTLMSKTAGSIVDAALRRDPHEVEFIQSVQEVVHDLERVILKNFKGGLRFHPSMSLSVAKFLNFEQDLPSEDMGVGTCEMGYLYGQYRRLVGNSQGSFTGPRITGLDLVFELKLLAMDW